jgi:selenocysteine-specific elongation factor
LAAGIERILESLHHEEPWAMGATSLALARATGVFEPVLVRFLSAFVRDGRFDARGGYYSLPSHQPRISAPQRQFFETVMPYDPARAFLPADFADVAAAVKGSHVPGISKAFDTLLARGTLVKVGEALYRATQIDEIHARVVRFFGERERMTVSEFRDLLETSRKHAVPLLEWFDGRGITVRSGDFRMLRNRRGAATPAV